MKLSFFLLVTAVLSFAFGAMMFFVPSFAADFLAMGTNIETLSALHGMGGLIIGSGLINFLLRNQNQVSVLKSLLITNIITHLLGIAADIWGVVDGALTMSRILPVELTHLFIGFGSLIYWLNLTKTKVN